MFQPLLINFGIEVLDFGDCLTLNPNTAAMSKHIPQKKNVGPGVA